MRKLLLCSLSVICCLWVAGCSEKRSNLVDNNKEVSSNEESTTTVHGAVVVPDDTTTHGAETVDGVETTHGTETVPEETTSAPIKGCSLQLPTLPVTVNNTDSNGVALTTVKIEDVIYEFQKNDAGTYLLKLEFKGIKTYEKENLQQVYNVYAYMLYDEEGHEIERNEIYCGGVKVGEKFENVDSYCGGNLPAGNYRLELLDY